MQRHGPTIASLTKAPTTAIFSLVIVLWLPYFSAAVVPVHDSMYMFQAFYFFYSDLLFNGELARWFPNGSFGTPADVYQTFLHPTDYVVGLGGWLLNIRQTLVLWKIGMLANELLYGFGLLLLARQLYSRRLTQWAVTLCGVLSVSWLVQSTIGLGTFYLLPLVMYLILRFFQTERVTFLCLAGVVEIGSTMGAVPYFPPLHALVLAIFALPLCCEHPRALRSLVSPRHLLNPCCWLLLVATGVFAAFVLGMNDGLVTLSPDRDPVTGQVTLETFLSYGRLSVATTLAGYTTGAIAQADNTYYVGLLPLMLLAYALFTEKSPRFFGLAGGLLLLGWLSLGGVFARVVYHAPGMSMFRHIGLVFGMGSLLLLLASGFGFDRLALALSGRRPPRAARLWPRLALLGTIGCLGLADFWTCRRPNDFLPQFLSAGWRPFFAVRVGVYLLLAGACVLAAVGRRTRWAVAARFHSAVMRPALAPVLLLALPLAADMLSFRGQVLWTAPYVAAEDSSPSLFAAEPLEFLPSRDQQPPDACDVARLRVLTRPIAAQTHHGRHVLLCGFAQMDPWRPPFRTDLMCSGVYAMFAARGGKPAARPNDAYIAAGDTAFERSLDSHTPKLRLTRQVRPVADEAQARSTFSALADPDQTTVISVPKGPRMAERPIPASRSRREEPEIPGADVQVEHFSPNRLRAAVQVAGNQPAWLVYADAWHAGWNASVDHCPVPIARANLGFKAVRVAAGRHVVELQFDPQPRTALAWCFAMLGTCCGFGLCLALVLAVVDELRGVREAGPALLDKPAVAPGGFVGAARRRQQLQSSLTHPPPVV